MGGRLDVAEVEGGHVAGMVEDHAELTGELLDLLGTEREAREAGDVLDVFARDLVGHAAESTGRLLCRDRSCSGYDPPDQHSRPEDRVAKHPFLSDEWFALVEQLIEIHGADSPPQASIMINLTVTETPFGDERHMHMGAQDGRVHWGIGHADEADLTLMTDYETAREVFVTGDPQAGMQAFMAGKVRVQGDMAKLMAAQAAGGGPGAHGPLAEAIQGITE